MSHKENMRAAQLLRDRVAKASYARIPGLSHMASDTKIKKHDPDSMKEHEMPHWKND